MADDYARGALAQRAAFEATHPAALGAAQLFADEPVLRVVDLGAADGVNSHGLIRALAERRAGRPLIYALVDLPTNAWRVVAEQLRDAFGDAADGSGVVVIPAPGDTGPGVADVSTGAHYASPEAHGEACRRALESSPAPATVMNMAGIPLPWAPDGLVAGNGPFPATRRSGRGRRAGCEVRRSMAAFSQRYKTPETQSPRGLTSPQRAFACPPTAQLGASVD